MSNKKNQKNKIIIGVAVVVCIGVILILGYWIIPDSKPYGNFYIDPIAKKDKGHYATVNFDREGLLEGEVAEIRHNRWTASFQNNKDIMHEESYGIAYTDIIFRDNNGNIDNGPFDGDETPVARLCFDIPSSMMLERQITVDIEYNGKKYSFGCEFSRNKGNESAVKGQERYLYRASIELGRNNAGFWKPLYEEYIANGRKDIEGKIIIEAEYIPSMYSYSTTIVSRNCRISDIAEIVDDTCGLSGDKSYDYLLQTEGKSYVFDSAAYTEGDLKLRTLEDGTKEVVCLQNKEASEVVIPKDVISIKGGAFQDCTSLTSVTIPNGVTSIGNDLFRGCESLTSVTIPDSVTSIGKNAFRNCKSLASITIPNGVTSIGENAFYNCESMTSVTIPNGVTSIGEAAFEFCESLANITLPDGMTSIGQEAFGYCDSLTSVTIPNSVTYIGEDAFAFCWSLARIIVTPGSYAEQFCKDNSLPFMYLQ